MSKIITVGRNGDQAFTIDDPTVSRKHCTVSLMDDGSIIVGNLSNSGTYIGGRSIVRKKVTGDTVMTLGQSYTVKVSDLLKDKQSPAAETTTANAKSKTEAEAFPYADAFYRLEEIYRTNYDAKIALKKGNSLSMSESVVPYILGMIPGVGAAVRSGMMARNAAKRASGADTMTDMSAKLAERFKIDYVCPKCGNFLGETPYEALVNRNKCNSCKCVWLSPEQQSAEQQRLAEYNE